MLFVYCVFFFFVYALLLVYKIWDVLDYTNLPRFWIVNLLFLKPNSCVLNCAFLRAVRRLSNKIRIINNQLKLTPNT